MSADGRQDGEDFLLKVEMLLARCDSLHRELRRLRAENEKLRNRNQTAKHALDDLINRLHDYTE